jgi:hypothetical protein
LAWPLRCIICFMTTPPTTEYVMEARVPSTTIMYVRDSSSRTRRRRSMPRLYHVVVWPAPGHWHARFSAFLGSLVYHTGAQKRLPSVAGSGHRVRTPPTSPDGARSFRRYPWIARCSPAARCSTAPRRTRRCRAERLSGEGRLFRRARQCHPDEISLPAGALPARRRAQRRVEGAADPR